VHVHPTLAARGDRHRRVRHRLQQLRPELRQPYAEVCRLIGDDASRTPPADGAGDRMPDGRRFHVASNGRPSIHRIRPKRLAITHPSEEATRADELRAVVTLTLAPPERLS